MLFLAEVVASEDKQEPIIRTPKKMIKVQNQLVVQTLITESKDQRHF